jgi:predicted Fe-Mo cluster-binding NifX family protein
MNIAITSEDGNSVTDSAESCHYFLIYEIGAGKILNKHLLSIEKHETLGKSRFLHENHPLDGVRVLISLSIGNRIGKRLKMIGITPFVTNETVPDEAIGHYLKGDLLVEPVGLHRKHQLHMLKDEKNYVPAAGTRALHAIN